MFEINARFLLRFSNTTTLVCKNVSNFIARVLLIGSNRDRLFYGRRIGNWLKIKSDARDRLTPHPSWWFTKYNYYGFHVSLQSYLNRFKLKGLGFIFTQIILIAYIIPSGKTKRLYCKVSLKFEFVLSVRRSFADDVPSQFILPQPVLVRYQINVGRDSLK